MVASLLHYQEYLGARELEQDTSVLALEFEDCNHVTDEGA